MKFLEDSSNEPREIEVDRCCEEVNDTKKFVDIRFPAREEREIPEEVDENLGADPILESPPPLMRKSRK